MKSFISKVAGVAVTASMVATAFAPMVAPIAYAGAPTYSIDITSNSLVGTTVNLSGIASATKFAGQFSQYHVDIFWETDVSSANVQNLTENGDDFSGTWSGQHTYQTSGTKTITVALCHQGCTGAEGADATDTFQVTIPPQCADGIDNDDDGFVDFQADPGCTDATDNTESPNPVVVVTNGDLVVNKVIINDNGGSAATSSFSFTVNGGSPVAFESDAQNILSLAAGAYTVVEVAAAGYTPSYSAGCTQGVVAGATTTCTITNDDNAPTPPGNTPPTANSLSLAVDHDTATSSQVTGSDNETASNLLTFGTTSNPTFGTLVFSSNGAFTYTPSFNYTGGDLFTFVANDGTASSSPATVTITVAATTTTPTPVLNQCEDGVDNDGDGQIDLSDSGCDNATDNDETNSSGGSSHHHHSGGSSSNNNDGEVLGAQTGECTEYLLSYIKPGASNDMGEVAKLQAFLNTFEGNDLSIDGDYDNSTESAVRAFQNKYASEVLAPWGLNGSTGYVYYTTRKMVNTIFCKYEHEFPLTAAQLEEIAYVKTIQPTLHTQASTGGSAAVSTQTTTSAAIGTVVLPTNTDKNVSATTGVKAQTAATANASTSSNWFTNFINWLFGK